MAKSLAFWIEKDNGTVEPVAASASSESTSSTPSHSVDLHINYWLLNQDKKDEINYLDVGVKFLDEGLNDGDSINIYFPFMISKEDYISNIGEFVCNNRDLIQTIFNAKCEEIEYTTNTAVKIKFTKDESLVVHTQIGLDSNNGGVRLQTTDEGCILCFPRQLFKKSQEEGVHDYFRFRIKLNSKNDKKTFSQSYKHSDRFILSRLESTEIVDFRINEVRDLPGIIKAKNLDNSNIKKIHFFLIREVDSEFKQAHANFSRCRLLEKGLWKDYLELNSGLDLKLPQQMLIYHWKESEKGNEKHIDKFNAFAKFSKITVSKKTIIIFISAAILIGFIASFLGELLNEKFAIYLFEAIDFIAMLLNTHF